MANEWDSYPLRVDDEPASIFLDLALARSAPRTSHPTMAYLRVRMRQPRPDGLSSQEEAQALFALEDALDQAFAEGGHAIYAGRNTSAGNRDFYFYTADGARFESAAERAMQGFPGYEFSIGTQPDPEWRVYFDFLYPTPDDHQRMLNRRVLHQLAQHGDDPEKPRPIDHMAVFGGAAVCAAFIEQVRGQGFAVTAGHPLTRDDGSFAVEFTRADRPAEIHGITLELVALIHSHQGDYDGWGCPVEK